MLTTEVRQTEPSVAATAVRVIAGAPLLLIGLAHVFDPTAPMRPLVEAAGLPAAALLAPIAVGAQIVAGASLLAGAWARLGALVAMVTMTVALYSHFAIEVWPNATEPPLMLPLAVLLGAGFVLWRGAGRWSVDRRMGRGTATC